MSTSALTTEASDFVPLEPEFNPYDFLPAVPTFNLRSEDFEDGKPLDAKFAHSWAPDSADISPELHWEGFPKETRSFAVTCFDPDIANVSGFWHWMLIGLPVGTTQLPRGAGSGGDLPHGAFHIRNDLGASAYLGPAPPKGDRAHRYLFAVHALDVEHLPVTAEMSPAFVAYNMTGRTLARALIQPTFKI
jgi:Raf kinase inhibitor-like YbhB/YbcL family protein